MRIDQAKKAMAEKLEDWLKIPVMPSEYVATMQEFPYCCYTILAPRIQKHYFGLKEIVDHAEKGKLMTRSEEVSATMSVTIASQSRGVGDMYVDGEEEAQKLVELAQGFFLLVHNIETPWGEIVVNDVKDASDRTTYETNQYIKRYGFDVRFSFIRTDEMEAMLIAQTPHIFKNNNNNERK